MKTPQLLLARIALLLFLVCTNAAWAQSTQALWRDLTTTAAQRAAQAPAIQPTKYRALQLDETGLRAVLSRSASRTAGTEGPSFVLDLPLADGSFMQFRVQEVAVMAPALAAKFPNIKTYSGYAVTNNTITIKADFTEKGFHAMILNPQGDDIFIDPFGTGSPGYYMSYYKKDFVKQTPVAPCATDEVPANIEKKAARKAPVSANRTLDRNLRTYRLAVAATYEYSQFHGGTKSGALSAIVTSINRVNGVFEKEVAVRMVLVGDNDKVVYTTSNDPYTNDDGGAMLTQNINTLNAVLGSGSYDIGHVFSTDGGGVAYFESVCASFKAGGVTGQSRPVGDPFDIDYVAHEIGHQFGASHTQNNDCNRDDTASFEPGSGTTIMSYAGICDPNVANQADAMFHAFSIQEMTTFISTKGGNGCAAKTLLANNIPTANAGNDYTIPRGTPFTLTGSATDADGTAGLTYSWEQMNNEEAPMPPSPTATVGPAFRVFLPTASPARTFPRLQDILSNTTPTWEVLSTVGRSYRFRLVVRDNNPGGGFTNYDETLVTVAGSAGPFRVTAPNTAVSWAANSTQTVTWDVAGSNAAPVNCATVNILLSTNGGTTFPITLAANVPNTGSATVTVPGNATTQARIKVEAVGNIFFDVSNANFTITTGGTTDNVATVYRDCPFSGASVSLPVGDYTLTQLRALGVRNNDLSSVRVNSGFEVALYDNDNFQGQFITVVSNTECLTARSFNDRTTSLRVRTAGVATFFQDCGFGGYSRALPAIGSYTTNQLAARGILNNDLSSLRVNSGFTVVLFDGDNLTGDSLTVTTENSCLVDAGWNDRVSSIKVRTTSTTQALSSVQVYPNPVADKLYLTSAKVLAGGHYRILNGWGKPLASGPLAQDGVSVAALPAGMYTLVVVDKDGHTIARRFVK
ncbi:reprolysin-like metallopeptidase [Hymenobacter weizhouensis]|uniref:reprolysin-like metallopeptidase n=1 Tax=Hymenobacter sp. YIM 151500-1 TaxID=2987689 RepID=UPI002227E531|nr:zinc-dependent metalloprotease family protein [Hymenobacter sp. YIM 151500-1]UYZ63102.1 M12 family metallo-peptidase [Hymenobacter sp. YIM 151500-1]